MRTQNHPKEAARARFQTHLKYDGGLNEAERAELTAFEFDKGPVGLEQQLRRYCLQVKSRTPERGAVMMAEMTSFGGLSDLEASEGLSPAGIAKIEAVCRALDRYVSGFALNYAGHFFSFSRVSASHSDHSEVRALHMNGVPFTESALVVEDVKLRFEGVVFADLWPESIAEQICRLYSTIKANNYDRAKAMAIAIGELPSMGVRSEDDDLTEDDFEHIRTLCETIHEYHPRFVLYCGPYQFAVSASADSEGELKFTVNGKPYSG
ncbi:MAG: hypothetical protein WA194_09310 [Patescibacteria group bacterium]